MAAPDRLPTLFIPHGGGPWPFMAARSGAPDMWDGLARYLRGLDASLGVRPKAVLAVSGHWEDPPRPTVSTAARPPMIFDYHGFPEHTYRLDYPAPGLPALAGRVRALLDAAGIASDEASERGFDHGIFIPFMLIYPDADVPIVPMSLRRDLDPAAHLAIGRALAPLRDEGVLIVGSGMSYHNLRHFWSTDPRVTAQSERFDAWLDDAVSDPDPASRAQKLIAWEEAPDARACHPAEEHLLPLMVAAGAAADDRGRRTYNDRILGKALSGFQFG